MRAKLALGLLALLCLALTALAQAEVTQRGNLRVSFDGKLSPHALLRTGTAPVRVSVAAKIATTDAKAPPQLRAITIAINRNGRRGVLVNAANLCAEPQRATARFIGHNSRGALWHPPIEARCAKHPKGRGR